MMYPWPKLIHIFFDYSLRCEKCKEILLDWSKLSKSLKDRGMEDVVVSQVDCCIESDLCDTTDRRTTCVEKTENRGK